MTKTKRLKIILDLIKNEDVVVDIGADHGHLDYYIIKEGLAKKVIATDISAKSINKTEKMAQFYQISDKIECRVGDGFNPIKKDETKLVIIAGMGGKEISKIISSSERVYASQRFILQPAKYGEELRKFLSDHDFNIIYDECVFENGKYYDTMYVVKGNKVYKPEEIWFGITNLNKMSRDFLMRIRDMKVRMEKRINYLTSCEKSKLDAINKILNLGE